MATAEINFQVMDVGQGLCNFIEIYDQGNLNVPAETILVDLGSTKAKHEAGDPTVAHIFGRLSSMQPKPRINLLCLTHKDADHVNLLPQLLSKFGTGELLIDRVSYGGRYEWYTRSNGNILNQIKADYPTSRIEGFSCNQSDFVAGLWKPFWVNAAGDVAVYLLLANTLLAAPTTIDGWAGVETRPDGHNVNTKSLVLLVCFRGLAFVITGDATAQTLAECNKQLTTSMGLPPAVNEVVMMTLPHHGSKKTTFDLQAARHDPTPAAVAVVNDFAGRIKASTVTVSAFEQHSHPSITVIDMFQAFTNPKPAFQDHGILPLSGHMITAYVDKPLTPPGVMPPVPRDYAYGTMVTNTNVYGTYYYWASHWLGYLYPPLSAAVRPKFATQPALGVRWQYTVPAAPSQTFKLKAFPNRATAVLSPARAPAPPPLLARTPPRTLPMRPATPGVPARGGLRWRIVG